VGESLWSLLLPKAETGRPRADDPSGYDGYRHRKGLKVQVAVSSESLPLSVADRA